MANAAFAAERRTFTFDDIRNGRPADFYELALQKDAIVCSALLDALNKPQEVPDEFKSAQYYAVADQFFFLKNEFSMAWEQRAFLVPVQSPSGEVSSCAPPTISMRTMVSRS